MTPDTLIFRHLSLRELVSETAALSKSGLSVDEIVDLLTNHEAYGPHGGAALDKGMGTDLTPPT
ncbi:hypothetical protein AB0G06_43600 [Nonomuraea dietziae]|uniref:hypothetical protein n=1 Tax=Nonomuraea dietziae TaxID=65515 RepID=UPI0033F56289